MFCTFINSTVKTFRGEYKDANGTYPAAWIRAALKANSAPSNVYYYEDQSNSFDKTLFVKGATVDNLVGNTVVRTTTPVEKSADAMKDQVTAKIESMRGTVAHAGVVFSALNFATDSTTIESVNLIATALLDGGAFAIKDAEGLVGVGLTVCGEHFGRQHRTALGLVRGVADEAGEEYYRIDEEVCVRCGACKTVCPNSAITLSRIAPREAESIAGAKTGGGA